MLSVDAPHERRTEDWATWIAANAKGDVGGEVSGATVNVCDTDCAARYRSFPAWAATTVIVPGAVAVSVLPNTNADPAERENAIGNPEVAEALSTKGG